MTGYQPSRGSTYLCDLTVKGCPDHPPFAIAGDGGHCWHESARRRLAWQYGEERADTGGYSRVERSGRMSWPPQPVHPKLAALKPRRRNKSPEADLQKAMVQYLELALPPEAGVWWSASMSGVRLPSARAKAKAREQGLRPGMFDLCFIPLRGVWAGETFWFEAKSATGSLTPEQKILMDVLWPAGRGASGKTVESLCAALIAWNFPIRCRV